VSHVALNLGSAGQLFGAAIGLFTGTRAVTCVRVMKGSSL
jgi:hypothetical protein